MRVSIIALAAAGVLSIQQPAPLQPPVELFVTVTDENQRLVTELTRQDFAVYDNGKPQAITAFDATPRPLDVVVMLDSSGSMASTIDPAKRAADQFLSRLSPNDRAIVGWFNETITFRPTTGFTRDLQLLRDGLQQLSLSYPTKLYDAVAHGIELLRTTYNRRVIVLLSDGDDTASKLGAGEIIKRARAIEVTVYSVGVVTEFFNGQQRIRTSPDRGLKNLSAETGGDLLRPKTVSDWGSAFARVADELHSQYVLAFAPPTLDNKVHKLDVKLTRPGLTARTRKSYLAGSSPSSRAR
jgi:Ca-activated chloride channel homolog